MATTNCSINTPPVDNRCDDPAFREANPDLCKLHPVLILKPAYALSEPGKTVTYIVILRANGVEQEITKGLTWSSSNLGAAVINDEGVATGVRAGQTTISVTWQDLSAQAQLDVVGSCADTHQFFRIVIDDSKSMNQAFSSAYATKLSFSKSVASDFIETINFSKDEVAVSKFSSSASEVQAWTTDASAARAAVAGISSTTGKTDLADALQDAVDGFEGQDGVRVIVLFSDCEWTGDDPKPIAKDFRESGGFLVIVTTRAWGTFFADACEMASGGFLLSTYESTEDDILPNLSGLKNFICSGSCSPEPGTAPMAQLNYTGFINWNVTQGRVDLIGLGLWDVREGNGLYVDMQGTGDEGFPPPGQDFGFGQITSKVEYDFEDAKNYSFSLKVGGSLSKSEAGTWTIRIRVGNGVDETVTITNGITPLTLHTFTWTQSGAHSGPIIIEQTAISGHFNVGATVDEILLENVTDSSTMLDDDFDSENPTTIPPNPGYYGQCIELAPQSADPTPPTRLTE